MSTQIRGVKADFTQQNTVDAKPSASVILLRSGGDGLELFMLKRNEQLSFSPGLWVFPGGALEQSEAAVIEQGSADEIDAAFKLAAIRETFEESRVLLVKNDQGALPTQEEYQNFYRQHDWPSLGDGFDFSNEISKNHWQADTGSLTHISTWTTPVQAKKRFLTRFYLRFMPEGQMPESDGSETTEARWQKLSELKDLIDQGELKLMFPTEMNISWLSQFQNKETLLEALEEHTPPDVMPRMEKHPEGVMLNIPIEAGYGISQRLMRL
ncbi:NUDIX hydrolase [Pseudoteredinibacter isoporae]|uniref:8-oxo-dGTP pyrophosphatase MutT (NUDIX family) n=1 Tax=Pseudoteredinibacter isoporae TaxID=570281 RepID=A0A7X0JTS5_9GAMM|nr:NUDIX domain-containing protein [Pseudoteredinibacter isoporae]MBB6521588.1 8-oxo-dGTP pyrophosphatase MutT (NUDIX family) [Pseudoteredinibacter isoporae]NHO87142.1 NUDIX domain-containing protein [Pseudoteredinibacter isoporae]NIB22966.1 NUDIX domain-containing protein [Pseudoteredinibacter isoporae]